jgi:hypothetical protein
MIQANQTKTATLVTWTASAEPNGLTAWLLKNMDRMTQKVTLH